MEKISKDEYINQITDFYLKLKGSFTFLSNKEVDLILRCYNHNIPLEKIKQMIKEEFSKLPPRKQNRFTLINIEKQVESLLEKQKSKEVYQEDKSITELIKKIKKLNLPEEILQIPDKLKDPMLKQIYLENKIIDYIWKNMEKDEKEKLVQYALSKIKVKIENPEEKKQIIKSIIYTKLKEMYLI